MNDRGLSATDRARNEYRLANDFAIRGNKCACEARLLIPRWKQLEDRLENWDRIMSTASVGIFCFLFVFVCLVEYYFSKEIYRDILRDAPWLIALGFIAVAIFISEMVVYKFSPQKRWLMFYELRNNKNLDDKTDDEITEIVNKLTNKYFWIGLIFAIAMLAGLYFLSMERVEKELAAGERQSGFNIQDLMPVILYAVEIIVGVYVWYFIRRIFLGIRRRILKRQIDKLVFECAQLTTDAVRKYHDAEKHGYDARNEPVSDDLQEALYRHSQKERKDFLEYVAMCEERKLQVTFNIMDPTRKKLKATVHAVTDFKVSATTASNGDGRAVLIFNTYPGDSVRDIWVKPVGGHEVYMQGAYTFDSDEYVLYIEDELPASQAPAKASSATETQVQQPNGEQVGAEDDGENPLHQPPGEKE